LINQVFLFHFFPISLFCNIYSAIFHLVITLRIITFLGLVVNICDYPGDAWILKHGNSIYFSHSCLHVF
jgi:hypothetical protein